MTNRTTRRVAAGCALLAGLALLRHGSAAAPAPVNTSDRVPTVVARLPAARTVLDSANRELVIELPPVDVAPGGMVITPVYRVVVPVDGSLYRFRVEVVDSAGAPVRGVYLHHFNLTDPSHRELFLPIALHILAAGKETPPIDVPWFAFGMPIERDRQLIASGMLVNDGTTPRRGVRMRLLLH